MDVNFDPYKVLRIEDHNCDFKVIKKAYLDMVLETHPDKGGSSEQVEQVAKAFSILSNPKTRKEYDVSVTKGADFDSLKRDARDFIESQPVGNTQDTSKMTYQAFCERKDKERGINENDPRLTDNVGELLKKLEVARGRQDTELIPNKIFKDGEDFNPNKFNAAFDLYKNQSEGTLIQHTDQPMAFNSSPDKFFDLNPSNTPQQQYDFIDHSRLKVDDVLPKDIDKLKSADYQDTPLSQKEMMECMNKLNQDREYLMKLPNDRYKKHYGNHFFSKEAEQISTEHYKLKNEKREQILNDNTKK